MNIIAKYALPLASILLMSVFFLSLPDLSRCALPDSDRQRRRLTRCDALIMAVITLCYAAVAFYKLGNTSSPETFLIMEDRTEEIALEDDTPVSVIRMFTGVGVGSYELEYSADGMEYSLVGSLQQDASAVLTWKYVYLPSPVTGGYIRITGRGNVWLGEVVCVDGEGRVARASSPRLALCDEQELSPDMQDYMNSSYFDEVYHARTAWEHLNGVSPYEITHPPLGKVIISAGIAIFGMTPFGWRFSGTLFGALMLPLMYVFLKKLFGGKTVPAAGTLVFAFDFMHFVQTRIATIDTYAVFFILLMYLFMYLFITEGRLRYLALSGIFFGFGAASKWTCLYAGAGLAIIWSFWVVDMCKNNLLTVKGFLKNAGFCTLFFVLIPAIIYCLSYYPYAVARGGIPIFRGDYFRMVLDNQEYMLNYHSSIVAEHPYSSKWYQWILNIRPILYYLTYLPDGMRSSFGAFVNPFLCWGGFISLFPVAYMAVARNDRRALFIVWGYLAQLIPWIFITRLTFEYHYFPCTIFLVLSLSYCFELIKVNVRHWRTLVYGYAILTAACFVLFYPALSGKIVDNALATRLLGWLPTWPF